MKITAVVDRFEEDKAVLLVGEDEHTAVWRRSDLPRGVREGDYLSFTIAVDAEATEAARAETDALLAELMKE